MKPGMNVASGVVTFPAESRALQMYSVAVIFAADSQMSVSANALPGRNLHGAAVSAFIRMESAAHRRPNLNTRLSGSAAAASVLLFMSRKRSGRKASASVKNSGSRVRALYPI